MDFVSAIPPAMIYSSRVSPEQWNTVREAFDEALQIEPAERDSWLAARCGSDGEVLDEVRRLLAADGQGTGVLNRVRQALPSPDSLQEFSGLRVGPYELLDRIGQGGMGAVYRAARADAAFEKTVAIKLIGFQYAGSEVEMAFRKERQILAALDHPHIARLLDAGTTPEGLLYLVMELVEGEPIDAYCRRRHLDLDARLELFADVCSAVRFAHRNLVVHRDLKPQNILVTAEGQVKLLDFGIAKILTDSLGSDGTLSGRMTPQYASPEQIKGEPITTASDVYSLGLVLYELLTGGTRPYETASGNLEEILKAVCFQDAPRPSAVTTDSISKRLRGELDNVVLKALAKDPSRRYNSVEQLEDDISRYRTGLPLVAQGDALSYRFGKFVRRRRGWVAATALVFVSICGGVVATISEANEARRQQALAEKRYNDVRSLATTILFDIHDSIKGLAGSTPARQLAIRKGLEYLEALARDSEGDANLLAELAAGYERAGSLTGSLFDSNTEGGRAAAPILEKALQLRKHVLAARPADSEAHAALAMSYLFYGNSQVAAANAGAARDTYRLALALPPVSGDAMRRARGQIQSQLCNVTAAVTDASEAVAVCEEAIRLAEDLVKSNPQDKDLAHLRAIGHGRLANVLRVAGRPAEALPHFRLALQELQKLQDQQPSDSNLRHIRASIKAHLAYALDTLGDAFTLRAFADAIGELEVSLSEEPRDSRRVMVLAYALERYSAVLDNNGRAKDAEAAYERGLSLERKMAAKPTAGAYELNNLAAALAKCPYPRLRDPALAIELATRANELTNGTAPAILHTLAMAYFQNGQSAKAVETARRALSFVPAAQGPSTGIRKLIEEMLAQSELALARGPSR